MAIKVRVRTFNMEKYSMETDQEIEDVFNEQLENGYGLGHVWNADKILILVFAPQEPRQVGQVLGVPAEIINRLKRGDH